MGSLIQVIKDFVVGFAIVVGVITLIGIVALIAHKPYWAMLIALPVLIWFVGYEIRNGSK